MSEDLVALERWVEGSRDDAIPGVGVWLLRELFGEIRRLESLVRGYEDRVGIGGVMYGGHGMDG